MVTGIRGERRKQLLYGFKERTEYSNLKQETLDFTVWRTRFGIVYVAKQAAK